MIILLGAFLLGRLISMDPMGIPLYLVISFSVIIVAMIDIKIGIGLLIMSMLLSPEIVLGAVTERRNIVVRFDDLILILIFFVWLAKSAINKKLPLIKATPLNKYIFYYIGVCFIFTLKGIIAGDVAYLRGLFYIFKYLEYFIIFWMTYNLIETKNDVDYFMRFAVFTAICVIIYGYTQTRYIVAPFDGEINTMGGYLIIVMSVAMGTYLYHPRNEMRLFSILIFIICLPLLLRTESRASYLSFITMFVAIIYLFREGRKKIIFITILMLLMVPFIISSGIYKTVVKRIEFTFSGSYGEYNLDPSSAARLSSYKKNMTKEWSKKPFFGWGVTGRGFIDGMYVKTLVETGVIGMVVFLIMLHMIFKESKKVFKKIDFGWGKGITAGFMAAHIGLLVHATTSNSFIVIRIMEPYWFLLAVIIALPKIKGLQEKRIVLI
ncbi:MAG: O-antigen ligase family protein [Elusimicrobia bacterium]|nr:O-antigen ligase family protein [Elusimicrobiota bacterium]